jgi:hypothetical protein
MMRKRMLVGITGLLILSCVGMGMAQDLVLALKGGMEERFELSEVLSIKFDAEGMMIYDRQGGSGYWLIKDIERYYFEESTAVVDRAVDWEVRISPNPTSQGARIEIRGGSAGLLRIEILDGSGRRLEEIYRGEHVGGMTEVYWRGKEGSGLGSGVYYCRISLGSQVITQAIVVQ